jgi:hypothetical protein
MPKPNPARGWYSSKEPAKRLELDADVDSDETTFVTLTLTDHTTGEPVIELMCEHPNDLTEFFSLMETTNRLWLETQSQT